jgi:hypothetical protein
MLCNTEQAWNATEAEELIEQLSDLVDPARHATHLDALNVAYRAQGS